MATAIDHLSLLADYQARFLASIPAVSPKARVRHCGDWRVRDLVEHLAFIHHWAAARARGEEPSPLPPGPYDLAPHYARYAAELRGTLERLDPDSPTWTLLDDEVGGGTSGTVRFWHRRQAMETLVHLWDLRTAGGLDFEPGAPAWLDCLDEVVTVMHPRQVRLGRVAPPLATIRLEISDVEAGYLLHGPGEGAAVVVRGPARSLALLAWGRLPATDGSLEVVGDRKVLAEVLAAGLTP